MNEKGKFGSNFGFLMAALGSAVGLGNLWGFPYKLGDNGGFAFLLLYLILCVTVGYPLVLAEIALGRKTGKAAIEAYTAANKGFRFNGVLQTIVPFFLISFYCTFGGYVIKYLVGSIGAFFGGPLAALSGGENFGMMLGNIPAALLYTFIFIALTVTIVLAGVSGGIEKFCKYGMPALFIMLIIMIVKGITLPGAGEGYLFMFKPDFSFLKSADSFFGVLRTAGSQMFFSLSLASACLIAYGSYLGKNENLERDAGAIVIGDTTAALFAGMAIIPAAFALGGEDAAMAGPALLFITMTNVFQSMGPMGNVFQLIFWLLVFIAVLSSSIGMMEGGISAIMDARQRRGRNATRFSVTMFMAVIALIGNFFTTADALGDGWVNWFHILGQPDVLDVWDAVGEGILMPLTGFIMSVMLGWFIPGFCDDEIALGRSFRTKKFFQFCIRWVGPIFMAMIVYGQLKSFWG